MPVGAASASTRRRLSFGLALTNGCCLVADVEERELRGAEETYTAKHETSHPDKSQSDAQSGKDVEPKGSLKRSHTGAQQCDQGCASKCSQRNID